jgi:hypothetical protein
MKWVCARRRRFIKDDMSKYTNSTLALNIIHATLVALRQKVGIYRFVS